MILIVLIADMYARTPQLFHAATHCTFRMHFIRSYFSNTHLNRSMLPHIVPFEYTFSVHTFQIHTLFGPCCHTLYFSNTRFRAIMRWSGLSLRMAIRALYAQKVAKIRLPVKYLTATSQEASALCFMQHANAAQSALLKCSFVHVRYQLCYMVCTIDEDPANPYTWLCVNGCLTRCHRRLSAEDMHTAHQVVINQAHETCSTPKAA